MNKLIRINQIRFLFLALFKEIIREPGVLFWGIGFPILMSVGLGLAFTQKTDTVRKVAVIIESHTIQNDELKMETISFLDQFGKIDSKGSENLFPYKLTVNDSVLGKNIFMFGRMAWSDAIINLKRGNINLIIIDKKNRAEYHFDPLNPDAQLCYLKLKKLSTHEDLSAIENESEIKPLTVNGMRYIDFLVPGLIAMGVMMACMWGISYGIIEKRGKKLLRRMVATPMKRSHFLIALIGVRLSMNILESLILFIFTYFVFGISILGSLLALIVLFIAGNISFAGIAVFISARTSNTEIGNGLINAIVMPMMILSGIFFSYHNFPDWSIPILQILPLTMFAGGLRSIFLEGGGIKQIALPTLILITIGGVFFGVGLKFFKWH